MYDQFRQKVQGFLKSKRQHQKKEQMEQIHTAALIQTMIQTFENIAHSLKTKLKEELLEEVMLNVHGLFRELKEQKGNHDQHVEVKRIIEDEGLKQEEKTMVRFEDGYNHRVHVNEENETRQELHHKLMTLEKSRRKRKIQKLERHVRDSGKDRLSTRLDENCPFILNVKRMSQDLKKFEIEPLRINDSISTIGTPANLSTWYSNGDIKIDQNMATSQSNEAQLQGKSQIPSSYTLTIKILQKNETIAFGLKEAASSSKNLLVGYQSSGQLSLQTYNGLLQEFSVGDFVSMEVDLEIGEVEWSINGRIVYKQVQEVLQNRDMKWVPFLFLGNVGDRVIVYERRE